MGAKRKSFCWRNYLDRKGLGFLLAAACWGLIGQKVLVGEETVLDSAFHQDLPMSLRLTIWFGAATLALISVKSVRVRRFAIGALAIGPAMRVTSYLIAWVISIVPGPPPGVPDGWGKAAIFAVLLGFVFYVADDKGDSTAADIAHALTETTDYEPRSTAGVE